jgi:hypothetical protein
MKKLLLSSFLMLAAAGSLMAQDKKPKKQHFQSPKTERSAHESNMIAKKKAKAAEASKVQSREALKAEIAPAADQPKQAAKN